MNEYESYKNSLFKIAKGLSRTWICRILWDLIEKYDVDKEQLIEEFNMFDSYFMHITLEDLESRRIK